MTVPTASIAANAAAYQAGMVTVGGATSSVLAIDSSITGSYNGTQAPLTPAWNVSTFAVGDVLVAFCLDAAVNDETYTFSGPAWTALDSQTGNGSSGIFWRLATSQDVTDAAAGNSAAWTVTNHNTQLETNRMFLTVLALRAGTAISSHGLTNTPSPPAGNPTIATPPTPSGSGIPAFWFLVPSLVQPVVSAAGVTVDVTNSSRTVCHGLPLAGLTIGRLRLGGLAP